MITLGDPKLVDISPENLGELLIEAKKAYYTGGRPIMDDHTYDTLEDILRQKAPHHRIFKKVGTPLFDTGWEKRAHVHPMSSQNKVSRFTDLVHYFELKKLPPSTTFLTQPKCDGISLEILYKNGQLVDAVTRGDGTVGDVITQNVTKMQNFIPKPDGFTGSVRCEVVVTKKDFEKLNNEVKQINNQNGVVYSNPRNAASGLSQRLDSKYSEFCTLMAVDLINDGHNFKTEEDKVLLLQKLGFTVVDSVLCRDFAEIENIYQKFLTADRTNYPFEIDGLVVKVNDLNFARGLGSLNNRPKFQVAYKFPSQSDTTRVISVEWQVGPLGTVTPVAQVDPVELSGAIVTYASLANYDLIKEKNLNIGDIVHISRRGDVIPHIESVVTKVTPGHLVAPKVCPSCSTPLITEDKFLRCPNATACPSQILGSLRLFCDTLGILGLSDKTIKKLYDSDKVRLPGDYYQLKIDDISGLENLGEKSAKNIMNQIQSKRELNLVEVFDAAIIPNFSAKRIQQLIDAGFDSPDMLLSLTEDQIVAVKGFKPTLAQKILQGIALRRPWIESILSQVNLKSSAKSSQKLSGLTFAITGDLSRPRKDIEKEIADNGGKVASGVTKNTSYLLTNEIDSDSSKFVSAKKLGVPIVSEDEFQSLLSRD